jgi:polyferredoxin/formate hydrogenlyase subunit 6/NADH:ubiquinone oxidoreductase subunit I
MKKLVIAKRISQAFFVLLFVYILWSTTYPLTGPISAEILFKSDPLIMVLTSLSERIVLAGVVWSLAMIVLTLIFGRFFCGWVCPLGTVIDLAAAEKKNRALPDRTNSRLRRIKYWVLALAAAAALAGLQLAWALDPVVIFGRFVSLNLIPSVTLGLDALFSFLIRSLNLYGPVYDFYRFLTSSLLGVQVRYFAHASIVFAFFLGIVIAADYLKRSWCRAVCPLGALYGLVSRFSGLKRVVSRCSHCGKCKADCRMGAIRDDAGYVKSECILCMDCVYDCPVTGTRFAFLDKAVPKPVTGRGITRRQFLILGALSFVSLSGFKVVYPNRPNARRPRVIRPPASLEESEFLNRCVRCGNCMKVCITNGLQPALLQAGVSGIWTPHLVPEIGYCEYHCTLCGNVCPTGAIPGLTEAQKLKTRLGLARIDRSVCIPWKKKKECIVCEEHCPTANKAIQLRKVTVDGKVLLRPYINERLCIGCGICQTKCPVRPKRAIEVYPVRVTHGV